MGGLGVPESDELMGVFDYDGTAWDDRHHDFRYPMFDGDEQPMLDAAIDAYQREAGVAVDLRRIHVCNAVCAFSFLAFREGVAAERALGRPDVRGGSAVGQRSPSTACADQSTGYGPPANC